MFLGGIREIRVMMKNISYLPNSLTSLNSLFNNLLVAFSALVHHWGQSSPLSLHARIGLQLYLGFTPLNSVLLVPRNQVGKEERIGSLGTILWKNADEKEVNDVGLVLLDGSQHVEPCRMAASLPRRHLRKA